MNGKNVWGKIVPSRNKTTKNLEFSFVRVLFEF